MISVTRFLGLGLTLGFVSACVTAQASSQRTSDEKAPRVYENLTPIAVFSTPLMAEFEASYGKSSSSNGFPTELSGRVLLNFAASEVSSLKVLSVRSFRQLNEQDADRDQPEAECVTEVRLRAGEIEWGIRDLNGKVMKSERVPLELLGRSVRADDRQCATPKSLEMGFFMAPDAYLQLSYPSSGGGIIGVEFQLLGEGLRARVSNGKANVLAPYRFSRAHWWARLATSLTGEPRTSGFLDLITEATYLTRKNAPAPAWDESH